MNRTKTIGISLVAGLLITGVLYKLMNPQAGGGLSWFRKSAPSGADSGSWPSATPAPPNPAHEIAALEEELKKKPGHGPILLRLAELERQQSGGSQKAIERLKAAVAAEPDNAENRLELGRALYEAGNVEGAIEETRRILDKNPKHVDALYNLGAIHANVHQEAKAREYWKLAIAAGPETESGRNAKASIAKLDAQWVPAPQAAKPPNHP